MPAIFDTRPAKTQHGGSHEDQSAYNGRITGTEVPLPRAEGLGAHGSSLRNLLYFVLCKPERLCYTLRPANTQLRLFLGSSAVEHSTVNRMVAGSNPARGASRLFRPHSRRVRSLLQIGQKTLQNMYLLIPPRSAAVGRRSPETSSY
jgi:hypothetical protein